MKKYLVFFQVQLKNKQPVFGDTIASFDDDCLITSDAVDRIRAEIVVAAFLEHGTEAVKVIFTAPWMLLENK